MSIMTLKCLAIANISSFKWLRVILLSTVVFKYNKYFTEARMILERYPEISNFEVHYKINVF